MHGWGKAPPIDKFTAEDKHITFDDWLPILEPEMDGPKRSH